MQTQAVVIEAPFKLSLQELELPALSDGQLLVEIERSGISTGTEKLLWRGEMPKFPGLQYPLVPGYESIGRVVESKACELDQSPLVGQTVFVPGASCYGEIAGLFGGSASMVVVDAKRVMPIAEEHREDGVLLALAATAYHALKLNNAKLPELIIGHGVLGRLLARLTIALGGNPPTVWELAEQRAGGAEGYSVVRPQDDDRFDYQSICDASGSNAVMDDLVSRVGKNGEIILAGFYPGPVSFNFPPAFMREISMRIAAEWQPQDLVAISEMRASGQIDLSNLITHTMPANNADAAYRTAFDDLECLKMVLDWRTNT